MTSIQQQLLIGGTVLFLVSLLLGFAIPLLASSRMGVSAHTTGLQSGLTLWALGLMWQYVALPPGAQRAAQVLAIAGLFAIFAGMTLAAVWGASRALPLAGAGHAATPMRETIAFALIAGGSVASVVAVALVLWGLVAYKA